jgi:hypothetical protein
MKKIPASKPVEAMTRKQLKRLWRNSDPRFPLVLIEWKRRNGGSAHGL